MLLSQFENYRFARTHIATQKGIPPFASTLRGLCNFECVHQSERTDGAPAPRSLSFGPQRWLYTAKITSKVFLG